MVLALSRQSKLESVHRQHHAHDIRVKLLLAICSQSCSQKVMGKKLFRYYRDGSKKQKGKNKFTAKTQINMTLSLYRCSILY